MKLSGLPCRKVRSDPGIFSVKCVDGGMPQTQGTQTQLPSHQKKQAAAEEFSAHGLDGPEVPLDIWAARKPQLLAATLLAHTESVMVELLSKQVRWLSAFLPRFPLRFVA